MRRRIHPLLAGLVVLGLLGSAAAHAQPATERSTARYRVPDVELVRADGTRVRIRRELDDGKPVVLDFVFTTCPAVCPVLSRTLAEVQKRAGAGVQLVSISIDPEHDTPARLKAYAKQLAAGPSWSFYTGSVEASQALQRAFDAYRGDKMNHQALVFVRSAPNRPWVRLEGFASANEVLDELRRSGAEE
jgi:protein SCO1/2